MQSKNFEVGDIIYSVSYAKVLCANKENYIVRDVYSQLEYKLQGAELINTHESAIRYDAVERITLSNLVKSFLASATGEVFAVGFIKADGTLRVLRGAYLAEEPLFGRTKVIDFDNNNEIRLVDHRTLQFLVSNGILCISEKCEFTDFDIDNALRATLIR